MFVAFPFLSEMKLIPDELITAFHGSNLTLWIVFFIVSALILKTKNYDPVYCLMMGLTFTFFGTELWEIPIHILTVTLNPTFTQLSKTLMLSTPHLGLVIPIKIELNDNAVLSKPETTSLIVSSVLTYLIASTIPILKNGTYPPDEINLILRATIAMLMCLIVSLFPEKVNGKCMSQ